MPYENFIYIGDSATDIPCMRLVRSNGGYSIGVYDPEKGPGEKIQQLYADGRIDLYAPADYTEDSNIARYVRQIIDVIAAKETIKSEQRKLKK